MAFFNDWYIKTEDEISGNSIKPWGVSVHVDAPIAEPKTSYQDVFGLNGTIDYTDFVSGVKYADRQIKMYLVIRKEDITQGSGFADVQEVAAEFARKYHGQRVEISRATDDVGGNWQTYKGRLRITADSKSNVIRLITCIIDADPFVYFDNGEETISPIYRAESVFVFSQASIIEGNGLTPTTTHDGYTTFIGSVGRYAVWNLPVYAHKVVFPFVSGDTTKFDVEFSTPDGEIITLDGGGYYSTTNGNIKVKLISKARLGFSARMDLIYFEQQDNVTTEMRNIKTLKMPSDIFYTNQNEGAKLFLNGEYFDLEVTSAGKYVLLTDTQLLPNQSNWITVFAASSEDVATATDVVINYDNRDLVGVPDV